MPDRTFTFGIAYDRERGESKGLPPRQAVEEIVLPPVGVVAAPDTFGVLAQLGFFCAEVVSVVVRVLQSGGTLIRLEASLGDTTWIVTDGATGMTTLVDNGSMATIELAPAQVLGGPPVAFAALRFNGGTLVALGMGAVLSVRVRLRDWGAESRISHARALFFQNSPIARENLPGAINQLELVYGTVGGRAVLGAPGSSPTEDERFVEECSLALPHPCGVVWVGPTDIGNLPSQIPTSISQNNSVHYLFHPSAFFRHAPYERAIQVEQDPPWREGVGDNAGIPEPITTPRGALTVFQVNRPPTHSRWRILVDSAEMEVIVAHPAGSDLRKPVDVYRSVWLEALRRNEAIGSPLAIFGFGAGAGFVPVQVGTIERLIYLEYAMFMEPLESGLSVDLVTVFYQDGAIVPPP